MTKILAGIRIMRIYFGSVLISSMLLFSGTENVAGYVEAQKNTNLTALPRKYDYVSVADNPIQEIRLDKYRLSQLWTRVEKRIVRTGPRYVQGKAEIVYVCKSQAKVGTCEYSETRTYTNEYSVEGTVDISFVEGQLGYKLGESTSKMVKVTQRLLPNEALKIYAAPQGERYGFKYQVRNGEKWETKGTGWVKKWTGVKTNVMKCTHSVQEGGCN
jgi:hypothetical protein